MPKNEDTKRTQGEMSFLDHLEVLRWHLVRSVAAILIFAVGAFVAKELVFDTIILGPQKADFISYRLMCQISQFLGMSDALCIDDMPFHLMNISMAGQFTTHLWVAFVAGLIVAFPYLLWEFWRFIQPALQVSEKKYAKGVVFFASMLFLIGVSFGYFLIAPLSVHFLGSYQVSEAVPNQIGLNSYISTVTTIVLAGGLIFELPILVYFLAKIGILSPDSMRTYRKHAFVATLIISAIITPPDISSQLMVTLPLIVLYEISIKIAARVVKKEQKING
jgi:sec-independent protein translocase protein TatC